jgi:golgi phosphoprotein 3
MLSIFEELFLLALDEEKGRILSFTKKTLPYGLSGGILAELILLGKVCSNEKHRLELLDASLTGDEILDEAIIDIGSSEKLRKLSYWVSEFSSKPKKLRERIGERLVEKELLSQEDRRFFWTTPTAEDTTLALTKFDLKTPLRVSILSNDDGFDPHNMALLSLASASGLLNLIFTQDELPIAQHRIHEKVIRGALGNPIMQSIEEIEQAIISNLDEDED